MIDDRQDLSYEQFVALLRSALHYLYDPVHLRRSPLVDLLGLTGEFDRAAALQRTLVAAIRDLNERFPERPIGLVHGLRWHVGAPFDRQPWPDLIATLEVRDHPRFATPERDTANALALTPAS